MGGFDERVSHDRCRVTIQSRDGAAATVIDARGFDAWRRAVQITASGVTLGKTNKGFTMIGGSYGAVSFTSSTVQGNIFVNNFVGLAAVSSHAVIRENHAYGNKLGFSISGTEHTVDGNAASGNDYGIAVEYPGSNTRTIVTGNVASGNTFAGFSIFGGSFGGGTLTFNGNAAFGNDTGILFTNILPISPAPTAVIPSEGSSTSPSVSRNSIYGNTSCGLNNSDSSSEVVIARDNYWGAATGAGPDPADDTCGIGFVDASMPRAAEVKVTVVAIK
jgi:parallel beta-helix repeat protein